MTDITLPYDEDTISGSFSYDITNNVDYLTIITDGLSAGSIVVAVMDDTTARTLVTYTVDANSVIGPLKSRSIRIVGTGVTCDYLSLA